jgi:ribosomal protein L28
MATKCDICGRGTSKDASRSHSNIKNIKRQNINLQKKTIDGKKMDVCVNCMKTMKKKKR